MLYSLAASVLELDLKSLAGGNLIAIDAEWGPKLERSSMLKEPKDLTLGATVLKLTNAYFIF